MYCYCRRQINLVLIVGLLLGWRVEKMWCSNKKGRSLHHYVTLWWFIVSIIDNTSCSLVCSTDRFGRATGKRNPTLTHYISLGCACETSEGSRYKRVRSVVGEGGGHVFAVSHVCWIIRTTQKRP